ncbi:MAG: flagellar biosynthetic protein FliO [Lachnospiraceae bacterium]|nr:flagellar biosynthetic protein FliO [Lachnospiraceae bacterium]
MILSLSNSIDSYVQFITVLIIFVFVLAITYFTSRWIAGYQKGRGLNANVEIMESFRLANNKYIQIVRVGKKYLAVAVGKDSVTMLTEIPEDQLLLSSGGKEQNHSFKELLEKMQQKNFLEKEEDRKKSE